METRVVALAFLALLDPPTLGAAQSSASTQSAQPPAYILRGTVRDSAGAPVPEAEVTVIEPPSLRRQLVTDSAGRFALEGVPAGPLTIRVHRLGYAASTVELAIGSASAETQVEIVLASVPAQLEEVLVKPDIPGRLREFYQHRQQRRSFARFLELTDIRRLAPTSSSELFRSVPGITIRSSSTGGNTIRIRGCQPTVWVDGQRIPGAELDDVIQPNDIGGIEFYPSSAGIPPQYMDPTNRLCGSILVWTRSQ